MTNDQEPPNPSVLGSAMALHPVCSASILCAQHKLQLIQPPPQFRRFGPAAGAVWGKLIVRTKQRYLFANSSTAQSSSPSLFIFFIGVKFKLISAFVISIISSVGIGGEDQLLFTQRTCKRCTCFPRQKRVSDYSMITKGVLYNSIQREFGRRKLGHKAEEQCSKCALN